MSRIVERIALIFAAVAAAVAAAWGWMKASTLRKQLGEQRARVVVAELEAAQADADAAAAKAREEAARDQAAKIKALNAEVVRVDPRGDDLAGAFDRATSRNRDDGER